MANSKNFELPGKIEDYLAALSRLYVKQEERLLLEIVVNGSVNVEESYYYDRWDGGTYGHALFLSLPEDLFFEVREVLDESRGRIREDINALNSIGDEYIYDVFIKMELAESGQWRESSGIMRPRTLLAAMPKGNLLRIWGDGFVRVFLSHKASFKVETSSLKDVLMNYGIASFVAHEDIEPTQEWQQEIENALFSMDALVALLSEDFHDSNWTDQEVGVAIGRGVPIIPIRLGIDPYGLMGKMQGLGGCSWESPTQMADRVYELLFRRVSDKSRFFDAALSSYSSSKSFEDSAWKVENLLARFEALTSDQVNRVYNAYRGNKYNTFSFRSQNLLRPLLEKWTNEKWIVIDKVLIRKSVRGFEEEEIPF